MKLFTSILIFCFGQICFGQVPRYSNGDTIFLYKWQQEIARKSELEILLESTKSFHLRFSTSRQCIDVWKNDSLSYSGVVTNFIKRSSAKSRNKVKDEFIFQKTVIDSTVARKVYAIFEENFILEMPTHEDIENWNSGKDGDIYVIEYSVNGFYSLKDYWSPEFFKDNIDEANRLCRAIDQLEELLNLNESCRQFMNSLPARTYTDGNVWIMIPKKKRKKAK